MHRKQKLEELLDSGLSEKSLVGEIYLLFREPIRRRLPKTRKAYTGKLVIKAEGPLERDTEYFVTMGFFEDGALGEIFVRQQKEGSTLGSILDALAMSISVGLQCGIPWDIYASKFRYQRFSPQGLTEDENPNLRMVSSALDYFVRWIDSKLEERGIKADQ